MTQQAFQMPQLSDDSIEALYYTAIIAFDAGNYEDAYKIYRAAAIARPTHSRAVVGMGASLYGLNRIQEAEAAYGDALQRNEQDQEAHLYLGELIWNERRDAEEATKHLLAAFRIQSRNVLGERARLMLSMIKQR